MILCSAYNVETSNTAIAVCYEVLMKNLHVKGRRWKAVTVATNGPRTAKTGDNGGFLSLK